MQLISIISMALSNEAKHNIVELLEVAKTTFRYACIPVIIYLGLNTGPEPRPSILSLISMAP
eukprot:m.3019 g.3019  ORF g.3019 m.3019 type:complete len:62 (+) comp4344_c0_seq1:6-191(+)